MQILDFEYKIGIEVFLTQNEGIGGKLRTIPQDFIVDEISKYPIEKKDGNYAIAEVSAINWETNHLIKELSNKLHISRKRISFAGTKDKRSKSKRLMSFFRISKDDLNGFNLKDVEIKYLFQTDKPVRIGTLIGNKFDINIRGIKNINTEIIENIYSYIKENGGFPNFYGIQRFGAIRPITHIVGKYIVNGDFEKAVMTYVGNPMKGEDELSYRLRSELEENLDFSSALKSYPNYLSFEKSMLNKLVVDPNDYVGALNELPRNLLTMFIYAYQSYLFNKIISKRLSKNIPLNRAVIGDIIYPLKKNEIEIREIPVTKLNIEKVNREIDRGKAFVTGLLFGSHSNFSKGEMGEIEKNIIEKEKVDHRDFIIPEIPFLSSKGSRRAILALVNNLTYSMKIDNITDINYVNIKFELSKGCYATSFLREFMKSDDIKNY
ncbi:MAG: tRNA pseudouridine(13) synthase TruD [Candidatus Thermoplasmatota archaeon]|nr:tRNA pseudouridine(13) synthase TruD [Candidatus Thermoplasmatota archaeon]